MYPKKFARQKFERTDLNHLFLFFQTLAGLTITTSVLSRIPVEKMTRLYFITAPGIRVTWLIDDSREWDDCPIDIMYIQTALEMMNLELDNR